MTEGEAKTKMCCGPLHFSSTDHRGQRCLGSECMAWRWTWLLVGHGENHDEQYDGTLAEGRCGLAGEP